MFPTFTDVPGFLDLGAWTTHAILPFFYLFKNDNVAPALALVIFLVALALCTLFLIDSIYIRAHVRRRIRAVSRIKDKPSFVTEMPQLHALMLRSRYLRHSWQKFRETLIDPRDDDQPSNQVVRNTVRPQAYFNMAEAGLRFPLYRAMPNLLVGVGLLLTFFGLVTALFFTNEAIRDANNIAASQDALRNLLHAASFKFYTSIAGLGGSIILTLVLRYGTSKVESSFDALAVALERKLLSVTSESIAFDHFREAQEQTKNLKLFNTEVALTVGKHIEQALAATLPGCLAQAMEPIGKSLNDLTTKLTSNNEGAIDQLAGSFADKLQGVTGEQMNGIATTLGGLRSSLETLIGRMNDSGSGLVENVGRSTQEMRDAVTAMTSALADVTNRMTASSQQASANFTAELTAATTTFQSASGRAAGRIEEAVQAITREVLSKTAGISEKVAGAAVAAGEESRSKLIRAGEEVAETVSGIGQQLADAVIRMQDGLNGAAREMTNIERGIAHHVETVGQLSKAIQGTESAMLGTAQSMREAGAPLAESSRLIAEASRMISDATSSTERTVGEAQTEIRNIGQLLHASLEATAQQWRDYATRFKGADESLVAVLDRIIQSVHENLAALQAFVEKIDEKLSGAVDKLGGGIDDLGEFAQNMELVTARLNGGGNGHARPTI